MVTKTLKDLFHEIYTAKSSGDKAFIAKHPIVKKKDLDGNGDDVFNATNVKRSERKKERHGYEAGDDAKVYEDSVELNSSDNIDEATSTGKLHQIAKQYYDNEDNNNHTENAALLAKHFGTAREKRSGIEHVANLYQRGSDNNAGRVFGSDMNKKYFNNIRSHYNKISAFDEGLNDIQWFEEGYCMGDMVNVSNPKASAQYKLVAKNKTHYTVEKPNGEQMKMPKERIARVNKQAWELRKAKKVTSTTTHTGIDEAMRAVTSARLSNHLIDADSIKHKKDGTTRIARGFFYRSGSTSDGHAEQISKGLNELGIKHKVVDHGTQDYKPFKGGASTWTQNHHWVDVKIHPDQKIEESLDEAVEVVKKDGMVTVHDGSHQSFPLHPEHQQKIAGLSKGEKTSFKDETGKTVTAERTGSLVHLNKGEGGRTAAVSFHHFKEDIDQINELSKNTLKNYMAKSKEDIINKAESEGLDELSGATMKSYYKKADADLDYNKRKIDTTFTTSQYALHSNEKRKRSAGLKIASKKLASGLRKEDIINKAIATYLPDMVEWVPMTKQEKLISKLDSIQESQVYTLLELFDTLSEDNQRRMIDSCDTPEGIAELLNFAIENRGE